MRRFIGFLFLLGLAQNIGCQTPERPGAASVTVNVTAMVVESIEMVTLSDFNLGPVQPSQREIHIDPIEDGGAALLMFSGSPNREIRITYTQQVQMTKPGSEPLTVDYRLSGFSENQQGSSEYLEENPASVTLSSAGEYYVWVGCRLNIEKATTGTYDGDCAIEVEYN